MTIISEAIDIFVAARKDLNSSAEVTDEMTNTYDAAQLHLFAKLNTKSQNASTANLINHATLGERMSRYNFLRSKRGRPSREIPKLIIQSNTGPIILGGQQISTHMWEK